MLLQKNLVDCQLAPNAITAAGVLAAYRLCDRAKFVPQHQSALAYIDANLDTGFGVVPSPMVEARLIQAAALTPADHVLVIGAGGVPAASICALLASSVTFASGQSSVTDFARTAFLSAGLTNVTVSNNLQHCQPTAVILIGAVTTLPTDLFKHARLVAVLADKLTVTTNGQTTTLGQLLAPRLSDPILPNQSAGFVF